MKILSSFDTRLDEKLMIKCIREYWEWNVVMIKKHPVYLFIILIFVVIETVLVWILSYWSYVIYWDRFMFFSVIVVLLVYFFWMAYFLIKTRIYFTSYSPIIKDAEHAHIEDWKFEKFLLISSFMAFILVLFSIFNIIYEYFIWDSSTIIIFTIKFQIVLTVVYITIMYKIIKKLINFEMDYLIIYPWYIQYIKQEWVFWRSEKVLDTKKLKSYYVKSKWFINSLFWTWTLVFLSEWDREWIWELNIDFIPNSTKIISIIEPLLKNNNSK